MNKYRAKKTTVDGLAFDSKLEATRYVQLRDMQRRGEITKLTRQIKFILYAWDKTGVGRAPIATYIADFVYFQGLKPVIEDVKGIRTAAFNLKAKMFEANYGQAISIWPPKKRKARKPSGQKGTRQKRV